MLTVFRVAFGILCLLKTVDIAVRGPEHVGMVALFIAVPWAVASSFIIFGKVKVASAVIMCCAVVLAVASRFDMYNQHLYLIALICLILFIGRSQTTMLKAQLSIVYGFGALTKLNEAYLSGAVIYASAVHRPFWEQWLKFEPEPALLIGLAVASIAVEAYLAIGFWHPRGRWVALIIGSGFHLAMLTLMTEDAASFLRLSIFGLLMMSLYIPFFPELERTHLNVIKVKLPTRHKLRA